MRRNKFILGCMLIITAYFLLPDKGTGGLIKTNMIAILPYIMIFIMVYLVITINVLKRSMKKMDREMSDEAVINMVKIMNITFDVKRMVGIENLQRLYNQINFSPSISLHAKSMIYDAIRRKKVDIPLPSEGKKKKK